MSSAQLLLSIGIQGEVSNIRLGTVHTTAPLSVPAGQIWIPDRTAINARRGLTVRHRPKQGAIYGKLSPCLFVVVGQWDETLEWFAASVVNVDERPTTGGGLPDLWQSSIYRIVTSVFQHPNISTIIPIGAIDKARRTFEELHALLARASDEDTARISRHTGVEFPILRRVSDKSYGLRLLSAGNPIRCDLSSLF